MKLLETKRPRAQIRCQRTDETTTVNKSLGNSITSSESNVTETWSKQTTLVRLRKCITCRWSWKRMLAGRPSATGIATRLLAAH